MKTELFTHDEASKMFEYAFKLQKIEDAGLALKAAQSINTPSYIFLSNLVENCVNWKRTRIGLIQFAR